MSVSRERDRSLGFDEVQRDMDGSGHMSRRVDSGLKERRGSYLSHSVAQGTVGSYTHHIYGRTAMRTDEADGVKRCWGKIVQE